MSYFIHVFQIVLYIKSIGFIIDFSHDIDGLINIRNRYLVSIDQVKPRYTDLNWFINIQVESIDVFTFPFCQESNFFDWISSYSNHCMFEHLADFFFDCL